MKRTILCSALALSLALTLSAQAATISVNFVGNNGAAGTLASADVAGFVPTINWNNATGSAGALGALQDNTGAATSASMSFAGNGIYTVNGGGPTSTSGGDEIMMSGFVYGTTTVSVTGIPYSGYNLLVYYLNDADRGDQTIALSGGPTYHANLLHGVQTGYVDNNSGTPMTYTLTTGTTSGTANNSDYVAFNGLTGNFSFTIAAPGNGALMGFEIVSLPEPSSIVLAGLAAIGLAGYAVRRRRTA